MHVQVPRSSRTFASSSRPCKTVRSVSNEVHDRLVHILRGESVPKKERTAHDRAAYRVVGKRLTSVGDNILNPLTGRKETRVMVDNKDGYKTILLKNNEIKDCINLHFTKYKGAGARKLHRVICKTFTGVTERAIQVHINENPKAQRLNPGFLNKVPPKPVGASDVMNQVQVDLVDMSRCPCTSGNCTYKYILVVLDVFSRFCYLRALQSKSSTEVAGRLLEIFSDAGPPLRLQSDQGTEFKGAVKKLMKTMQVRIIHSRPYHPQAQGKVLQN